MQRGVIVGAQILEAARGTNTATNSGDIQLAQFTHTSRHGRERKKEERGGEKGRSVVRVSCLRCSVDMRRDESISPAVTAVLRCCVDVVTHSSRSNATVTFVFLERKEGNESIPSV